MKKKYLSTILLLLVLVAIVLVLNDDENEHQIIPSQQIDLSKPLLRAHYIDVGQADATLLQIVEDGDVLNMLIDTGDWNRTDVVEYLEKEHIKSIDIIAITHAHADHIGQLAKIIAKYDVGEVWMNGESSNSQVFANALDAIDQYHVDYEEPQIGDTYDIGSLQVDIIHTDQHEKNANNNSISMLMTYGDVKFLFTGDAEKKAERQMLERNHVLKAHVFQLGHHGSNTSNMPEFYEAVEPQVAIYSAGKDNAYGLPNQEVLDRVMSSGAKLYGTLKDGTVIVESDGKSINVQTEKHDSLPVPLLEKSCINLNTASKNELMSVKHIGEQTATDIIQSRPFNQVDELLQIHGIGHNRLQMIKEQDLICTGGAS